MKFEAVVMFALLLFFSLVLAAVLSCYREDEKRAIVRGTLRRAAVFYVSVCGFAAVAYMISVAFLMPSPT
mgnify:CR=1 FL=1|jgi:hypothetical protein